MSDYQKQGFLLEDFRLFHLVSPQGVTTELHYHEFCKILFLIRGSGEYLIDGKLYAIRPGDILLINAGSVHRAQLSGEEPYERIILYILPEYLQKLSTESCPFLELFSGPQILRPREDRFYHLACKLEQDLSQPGFGQALLCQADLMRLLIHLTRKMQSVPSGPQPVLPRDPRVAQILAFLDAHFTEDLSIEDIAQSFFLSKYHMMRLFKTETGISIHQYITQKRLLLARSYMSSGMRATESCYRSGFGSYSSFTRASAKLLGTTPTGRGEEGLEE